MTLQTGQQTITINILPDIKKSKDNQKMKFSLSIQESFAQ